MYAPFFGLKHEPFSIAPDPRFLFMSERHREALAHLLYGLRGGGGFVLLTGEIGAGKTTVCRCFLEQIPKRCNVAYIFNPKLTVEELLKSVCEEFRIPLEHAGPGLLSAKDYVDALNHFLLRTHAVGQNNVLIIDEAQNLSADVLEQLRLLTNLETNERKLLQIILIGQPELRAMLSRAELEQLAQRVIARYHLEALSERETRQYVHHRLGVAGMSRAVPFDGNAMRRIHKLSRGIPRRINLLCDRALLGAYASGNTTVDRRVVDHAAGEVFDSRPMKSDRLRRVLGTHSPMVIGGGVAAGILALGTVAWALGGRWSPPASQNPPQLTTSGKPTAGKPAASAALVAAAEPVTMPLAWPPLIQTERDAWRELAAAWNATLPEGDPCQAAPREQLQCFRSGAGDLTVIRRLDRPAILTLYEDGGSKAVYALLTGLTDRVATLRAGQEVQTVSLAALAGVWRGEFATFWRTPPGYGSRGGDAAEGAGSRDWLIAQLDKLTSTVPAPGNASADLKSRVAAFQLTQGLKPDGLAGPITFMQLNRAAGVEEPRLRH